MTVTIDTGWHPLVDGSPPDWASAWGQDRFGVYVAFQIGAATQRLRWIPPGRFWMGSPEDEAGRGEDEGPRHEVTLESGFWLFDTPCTQALWEAVMGGNPSRFVSPTRPVEQVSFEDAERFLARVNERVPKLDLVLPSEAQWEYACRAGTETASYAGAMSIVGEHNAPVLDAIAWYGGNSGIGFELENGEDSSDWPEKQYDHAKAGTRPVGLKAPNPWGLHDMLGNVWEWCADTWHANYAGVPTDSPAWTGTAGAADRVFRGGSWHGHARSVRAASRSHSAPSYRDGRNGFRCARVQSANVLRGAVRKETSRNTLIRLPITIATGNCFTLNLLVGSQATPVNVLLDTGSSMTAVNIDAYDPGTDPAAVTSNLLQSGSSQAVIFLAAVVQTPVGLQLGAGVGTVTLPKANLGVAYRTQPSLFGNADGILGLAYPALNSVNRMPGNTWDNQYTPAQLGVGQSAGTILPFIDQLVASGEVVDKFAFAVQRSIASQAADEVAAATMNTGVFVIGDGEECTDLYVGDFVSVSVVREAYYNTSLVAVEVGNQAIQVPPVPEGSQAVSNSFLDSGSSGLMLDPSLYQGVISLFNAINPAFGRALQTTGQDQTQLDLAVWPTLRFVLLGTGGAQVSLAVAPKDYWQFDSYGAGTATTRLISGGAPYPGQSILGLPLFAGHYVVFDRTGGPGKNVIKFATRR